MKFCKSLRQIVETSDPEWAPYCTNYKLLKKLIKELPTTGSAVVPPTSSAPVGVTRAEAYPAIQERGEASSERMPMTQTAASVRGEPAFYHPNITHTALPVGGARTIVKSMASSPGEVAFFKLLHAEYKKATHFFDMTQEEFIIREHRVREGIYIMERAVMKKSNPVTVTEKWNVSLHSLCHLYKDLLQFETFAIMTYCSFSKILKKHDKVTGYNTRNAFMNNVVHNANFANYPVVLEMIQRCERRYEQVLERLRKGGNEEPREDVNLFINMVRRMNDQLLIDSAITVGNKSSKETRRGQGTKRRRDEEARR
jgi:SPX domain